MKTISFAFVLLLALVSLVTAQDHLNRHALRGATLDLNIEQHRDLTSKSKGGSKKSSKSKGGSKKSSKSKGGSKKSSKSKGGSKKSSKSKGSKKSSKSKGGSKKSSKSKGGSKKSSKSKRTAPLDARARLAWLGFESF